MRSMRDVRSRRLIAALDVLVRQRNARYAEGIQSAKQPMSTPQLPRTVDFVSDVICPWCFIGLVRVEQALEQTRGSDEPSPTIAFHPFQLDPSTPAEGADLRERLTRKYGLDPEMMFRRVEAAARESGIPLDYSKIRRTPNTLKAHALLGAAEAPGQQHALGRALFEAYFLEGLDIGDNAVLVRLAEKRGIDAERTVAAIDDPEAVAAVRRETQELAAQGISGVPFIIFDRKVAVSGAQSVSVFRQALDRARQ
jgi:predicted DsbA family dithiol-disulfide isomerase